MGNISASAMTVFLQVVSWLIEAKNIFLSVSATVASMLQNNYLLQERISKSANKLSID